MQFIPRCPLETTDRFLMGYLECAERCGLEESDREAVELSVSPHWSDAALRQAARECEDFRENWHPVWEAAGMSDSQAGHDFWLTRNRHGAGFWDRGIGEAGRKLTEAARAYGECNVDFDDDSEELSLIG